MRLLDEGWRVVARSWGARLRLPEGTDARTLEHYRQLGQPPQGYQVRQLAASDAEAVARFDAVTLADYPATPATTPEPVTASDVRERLGQGWLYAGVFHGDELVAVTASYPLEDRWEVDRTAVLPAHRRRGLATAVKAWSIAVLYERGVRVLGTGGAASNAGSLAMNRALGFELEPQWLTLEPPSA